jgi:hypothetical protein
MKTTTTTMFVLASLALTSAANAAVLGALLGTGAPPTTLGGYALTAFGADGRGNVSVTNVGVANGNPNGNLAFDQEMTHASVGGAWRSWSHDYAGDVYYTFGSSLTMTMEPGLKAFTMYAEPNYFGIYHATVTTSTGELLGQDIEGNSGAAGFGFWTTGDATITSISLTFDGGGGFAVGEFSSAVPGPATLALVGIVGIAGSRRRGA